MGDGRNRWAAVHRDDAARLYRLALESGEAGKAYHAIGDEAVAFGDIAAVIARRLGVPVISISPEEAFAQFGFVGMVASLDIPVSGDKTRAALEWAPKEPGLLATSTSRITSQADRGDQGAARRRPTIASALAKSAGSTATPEAAAFSTSCPGRLAPTIAEATFGSRRTQARENWPSVSPASAAMGFSS